MRTFLRLCFLITLGLACAYASMFFASHFSWTIADIGFLPLLLSIILLFPRLPFGELSLFGLAAGFFHDVFSFSPYPLMLCGVFSVLVVAAIFDRFDYSKHALLFSILFSFAVNSVFFIAVSSLIALLSRASFPILREGGIVSLFLLQCAAGMLVGVLSWRRSIPPRV